MADNRDKDKKIDESILEETPPDINAPQAVDDKPENQDPNPDPVVEPKEEDVVEPDIEPAVEDVVEDIETEDDKEKKYKAQQTETQIQVAKNKALIDKFDEGTNLPE